LEKKTVKVIGIEEKEGTKGMYWKVSTSPVLVPRKALFIWDIEQIQALEQDKFYQFTFELNSKGFIDLLKFEEVTEPGPSQGQSPGKRNKSFALSYAKDVVKDIYCAKIRAGQEVPDLKADGKRYNFNGRCFRCGVGWAR